MFDVCIIGAGIVGLSTAFAIKSKNKHLKILILEKEGAPGLHQTGHNSGVIHAGIYYAPGSLKAKLCREGLEETKEFCNKYNVSYSEVGKLIVATDGLEIERLDSLYSRARSSDLDLLRLSRRELKAAEPNISGLEAIISPKTSIVNYKLICTRMSEVLIDNNVVINYKEQVDLIDESQTKVLIRTKSHRYECGQLIVCAGLQSDRLAKMSGLNVDFKIVPFRGEYYKLHSSKENIVNRLIYPVPDPELPFLGIHLTKMIDGSITVGPNAVIGFAREGYDKGSLNLVDFVDYFTYSGFWKMLNKYKHSAFKELCSSISKKLYLKECAKYCPSLTESDLLPYRAGIRAQAITNRGSSFMIFCLRKLIGHYTCVTPLHRRQRLLFLLADLLPIR